MINAKKETVAQLAHAKDAINKALALIVSIEEDTVNKKSLADQASDHILTAHRHLSRAVSQGSLLQMRCDTNSEYVTVRK